MISYIMKKLLSILMCSAVFAPGERSTLSDLPSDVTSIISSFLPCQDMLNIGRIYTKSKIPGLPPRPLFAANTQELKAEYGKKQTLEKIEHFFTQSTKHFQFQIPVKYTLDLLDPNNPDNQLLRTALKEALKSWDQDLFGPDSAKIFSVSDPIADRTINIRKNTIPKAYPASSTQLKKSTIYYQI